MPDECAKNCPLVSRVESIEETIKQNRESRQQLYDRVGKLETENAVQNAHYNAVYEKLEELTVMVKELNGKAGKRWESLVEKALWAVIAAAITFLLARIGL